MLQHFAAYTSTVAVNGLGRCRDLVPVLERESMGDLMKHEVGRPKADVGPPSTRKTAAYVALYPEEATIFLEHVGRFFMTHHGLLKTDRTAATRAAVKALNWTVSVRSVVLLHCQCAACCCTAIFKAITAGNLVLNFSPTAKNNL